MLSRTKFHKQTRERGFRIRVTVIDFVGAQALYILFCVSAYPLLPFLLLWTIRRSAAGTSCCFFIIPLQGILAWIQCSVLEGRCAAVWKEAFEQELMFWHRATNRTPLNRTCLIAACRNSLLYHLHLITWSVTWMLQLKVGLRSLWTSLTWRNLLGYRRGIRNDLGNLKRGTTIKKLKLHEEKWKEWYSRKRIQMTMASAIWRIIKKPYVLWCACREKQILFWKWALNIQKGRPRLFWKDSIYYWKSLRVIVLPEEDNREALLKQQSTWRRFEMYWLVHASLLQPRNRVVSMNGKPILMVF